MSSTDPLPIRRLQESLINRIAAGEIIHPRPHSKSSSKTAGATSIRVTVKEGGLKLLQIQDNGCGIRKADLLILAERFTTSKLSTFSDLSKIATYGFRGEALASMSHVARLSVITKTKSETCAWKVHYLDGVLVEGKPGQTAEPKPCAGNDGTTIIIEDLFYNTPTRLAALRSASEEYSRILDVMTKWAPRHLTCLPPSSSEMTQAIRLLYGHSIAKDLLHTKFGPKDGDGDGDVEMDEDNPESWSAEAHFTNPNYQSKKMIFLLFINHRLVESPRIKRALENVYNSILSKGASPFVYLSLQINPRDVDVNVHPTKKERALAAQSQSRVFEYQTLLTGGIADPDVSCRRSGKGRNEREMRMQQNRPSRLSPADNFFLLAELAVIAPKKNASQYKVRTSLQDRTLDSMLPVLNPTKIQNGESSSASSTPRPPREIKESDCILSSVKTLRQAIAKGKHKRQPPVVLARSHSATELSEILEKHTFVGSVVDTPNLDKLPAFLMRLGPQVDWTSEKECFETFLRELAYFYVPGPLCAEDPAAEDGESQAQDKAERWQIQHIVFPALRRCFVAPKTLLDRDVVQIASLPDLYKVFESLLPLTPLEDYELALDGLKWLLRPQGGAVLTNGSGFLLSADELKLPKLDMPATTNTFALSLLSYPTVTSPSSRLLGATLLWTTFSSLRMNRSWLLTAPLDAKLATD
ncbi:hypothetical protein C8F01DRAFT_1086284 [Mycena amicta]|nr:hypothetical protein C8F01DRAFT_1086284 [Mycena amicta]